MSAPTPRRAPLEPFLPAVVGIGLAHLLLGMCVWIVLPLLPPRSKPVPTASSLTWFSPSDFLIQPKPQETPPAEASQPVPASAAVSASQPTVSPVKESEAKTASQTEVPTPKTSGPASPPPPETLASLEKSMSAPQGSLTSPNDPSLAAQATVSPPNIAGQTAVGSPTPAATGRAANKYITLSFNNDTQRAMGAKPTLNLLDIAKLNEATRVGQLADGGGLDAVETALQQALLREWKPPLIDAVPVSQRRVTVDLVVFRDGSVKEAVVQKPSGCDALDASVREALGRVTKIAESLPSSFPKERYPLRVNLLIE